MATLVLVFQAMAKRLAPTKETLNQLFALSGNRCAFPGCPHPLLNDKNKFIGQVCHIAAASDGGERANLKMTPEERRLPENLLILCYPHHIATDDVTEWTIPKLQKMKADHENKFRGGTMSFTYPPSVIDDMFRIELARIHAEVSQTLENTEQLLVHAQKGDESLEVLKSQMSILVAGMSNMGISADAFTNEINSLMDLRQSRQQEAALIGLKQFKERNWERLNPHDKFRTVANMGILMLELGDQDGAGDYLIESLSYEPDTIKALSMGALGYILKKNRPEAESCINKIWEKEPLHPEAWYAYIMLNKETIPYLELVNKIPDEVKNDSEVAFGLVQAASFHKNYAQSIVWAQNVLDNAIVNKFDSKAGLATCILQSLMNPYEVLSGQVTQDVKGKIKYVIDLFTEAWDEVKNTPLAQSRTWWLINRGVSRKFLPDTDGAYEDMLEACQHDNSYENLRHLAIAALDAEKFDKAIAVTDKMAEIATGKRVDETRLFKIELLTKKKDFETARQLSEEFLTRDLTDANRYHASIRLILIYMSLNLPELAKELNEKTQALFPEKIRPYLNIGKYSQNKEILKEQVNIAMSVVTPDTDFNEIYDLVLWEQRIGDFHNAAKLMEQITNQSVLSDFTRELLEIYYRGGETEKLLALSEKLLETYGPVDFLTEYKVVINQQIGNYLEAIKTCEEYLEIYPGDQLIVIRLGLLYDKADEKGKLKTLLSSIDHADNSLAFFIQKNLALLFFAIDDFEKFYHIGYEARRQYYDDGETHKEYVNMLMQRRNNAPVRDLSQVEKDFAVTVKIDDQNFETFTIEDRKDARLIDGELNLTHPIAIALLGKQIGDVVEIELPAGTKRVEIVDIKLKYTRAFYESLQLLTGKFFQTSGAIRFQAGTSGNFFEDFKPIADMLSGSEAAHKQLNEHYSQGRLTLGSMAVALNLSVIEVWRNQIIEEQRGLINQMFPPEQVKAIEEIKTGKTIAFDVVSLMTVSMTETFDLLEILPNRKIVTQSVFEELTSHLKSLEEHTETGKVHLKSDNGVILNSVETAEMIKTQIQHFKFLIEWVKLNCEVLPITAAIKLNAKDKKDLDEFTGASFIDTIITSEEQQALLIAEEKIIRAFASQRFQVVGSNLHTIIEYLRQSRKIDQLRYQTAVKKLILLNYKIVPMDSDSLYDIVSASNFVLDEMVLKSSLGIVSLLVLDTLPIKTVVDFLYKLYTSSPGITSSILTLRTNTIVKHCIDVLKLRFNEKFLLNRLLDMIALKFRLLPFQHEELKTLIIQYFECY